MKFADQRAAFNRRFFNRMIRPIAGRVAMWSVIEHRGRRSGKTYETPVSMFPTSDGVAILLPYGEDRDWVRNIVAAGGGRATCSGETFTVVAPRIVPTREAAAEVSTPWRQVIGRMRTPSTLLLRRAD